MSKIFLSLILLKLCVSDPKTISISNFNSYPNRRQIFFSDPKGGPFYVKKFFVSDFAQISCVEFLGPKYVSF